MDPEDLKTVEMHSGAEVEGSREVEARLLYSNNESGITRSRGVRIVDAVR